MMGLAGVRPQYLWLLQCVVSRSHTLVMIQEELRALRSRLWNSPTSVAEMLLLLIIDSRETQTRLLQGIVLAELAGSSQAVGDRSITLCWLQPLVGQLVLSFTVSWPNLPSAQSHVRRVLAPPQRWTLPLQRRPPLTEPSFLLWMRTTFRLLQ